MSDTMFQNRQAPAYPVQSVANALEILLLLRDQETIGVAEASGRLGVARSTAHRLLSMLEHYGFASQDPVSRQYRFGTALVGLGLTAAHRMDVRRRARPHMERLAGEVEETVTLMILEGVDVRFVDSVESPRPIRVGARVGLSRPAHCTSAGKAILASLSAEELDKLYPSERLPAITERSLTDKADLLSTLAEVRRLGYGTNFGESDADLAAVGVAIPDVVGSPKAGLGISAPATRLTPQRIEQIATASTRAARLIAETFDLPGGSFRC
jgi:DNA-binding IclR family transcriptional regulator